MHIATPTQIKRGKITDVYFLRTLAVLKAKRVNPRVKAEFIVKSLPEDGEWGVLAGIEEVAELLGRRNLNVRAMREGTIFRPYEPVLEIEGRYADFGILETALLGLVCQASGVATKAARCKRAAGEKSVISFGARRIHPAVAPMVERSAYIGGCDGVAVVASAELIEDEPVGTMPHALVILLGGTVPAIKAFHQVIERRVKRVALVDTFGDEKFEAVAAAEALGRDLYAIRLDTPASRRGNLKRILEEVRWELDLRGFSDVKIFVSGGLDEEQIAELNPWVDSFGVGTAISNARVIDFAMDIVEVEGKPLAKRGKMSGSKQVYRCPACLWSRAVPLGTSVSVCPYCGGEVAEILRSLIKSGRLAGRLPRPREIRKYVLEQLAKMK